LRLISSFVASCIQSYFTSSILGNLQHTSRDNILFGVEVKRL
jgi:hypothetical protein